MPHISDQNFYHAIHLLPTLNTDCPQSVLCSITFHAFTDTPRVGFTTGIPRVQISNTVPLPVNTVTIAGEGMTPYMFGYSVIPKNIKFLHYPPSPQPQDLCRRQARPTAALMQVQMLVVPVAVSRCVRARDGRRDGVIERRRKL